MTMNNFINLVTTYAQVCFFWGLFSYLIGNTKLKGTPLWRRVYDFLIMSPVITFLAPIKAFLGVHKTITITLLRFETRRLSQTINDLAEKQRAASDLVAVRGQGTLVELKAQLPQEKSPT